MATTQIGGLSIPISVVPLGMATGLARATAILGSFGRGISSIGASLGSAIPGAGLLLNPVTAVGAAIGGAALAGINFEKTMSHVSAVLGSEGAGGNMQRLSEFARHMGRTTQFSAISAAEGMVEFAQAGLKTQQIIDALPSTLQLAAAGGIELKEATAIAAKTMAQFGLSAKDMPRIADVLALAAAESNTNVHNLGEAFKFSGTMSKVAGKSLEETAAVTMALAQGGLDAEMAGTALRGMMMKAANQTEPAKKAMEELNLSFEDSDGNFKHMSVIFDEMQAKMAGMGQAKKLQLIGDIFEQRAATGFLTAMEQGGAKIRDWETQLKNAKGAAGDMSGEMTNNVAGGFTRVKNVLVDMGIGIFESSIEPWLGPLLGGLAKVVAFAAPVVEFFLKWGILLSPIGLIVKAIQFQVFWWGKLLDVAQPFFDWLQPVIEAAKGAWDAFVNMLQTTWNMVRDLGMDIWNFFTGKVMDAFAFLSHAFGFGSMITGLTSFRNQIVDVFITIEFILNRFRDIGELAFLGLRAGLETLKEDIRNVFTTVIPAYLNWLGDNWKNIFQDMANIAQLMMTTVMNNLGKFAKLLPGILIGNADAMTKASLLLAAPLVLEFEAKTKPLPEIAGRQITETEKKLHAEKDKLGRALLFDLGAFLEKRRKEIFGPKAGEEGNFWGDLLKGFKGAQAGPPGSAVDKLASAMESNSKEAVSLVNKFRNRRGVDPKKEDKMLAVAEKQLTQQQKQSALLDAALAELKRRNEAGKLILVNF